MAAETPGDTWETSEVIDWLVNVDEDVYRDVLGESAHFIRQYVTKEHMAPSGLYESFALEPEANWKNVDWEAVAEVLANE